MKVIQNLLVNARGSTILKVAKGTEFMQAMSQGERISLFSIGPLNGDSECREICAFYSGYALPDDEGVEYRYLGTAMLHGEAPVHVFERVQLTTLVDLALAGRDGEQSEPQVKK